MDEFVTEFSVEELFPPDLENALGRMRHFISYAREAGLVKEDRGVVELTDVGRRYVGAGDASSPFAISPQQAEWLRRQLREQHMTDSIFRGLAIGLSLLASCPPGTRVSTMDFGRSMAYLGRAEWDNEKTHEMQGERHLAAAAGHGVDRWREPAHGDRRPSAWRADPARPHVRDRHRRTAQPGRPGRRTRAVASASGTTREEADAARSEPVAPPESRAEEEHAYFDVDPGAWTPAETNPWRPPVVPRRRHPARGTGTPAMSSGDPLMRFVEQVPGDAERLRRRRAAPARRRPSGDVVGRRRRAATWPQARRRRDGRPGGRAARVAVAPSG